MLAVTLAADAQAGDAGGVGAGAGKCGAFAVAREFVGEKIAAGTRGKGKGLLLGSDAS